MIQNQDILTAEETARYSRQTVLPEVGRDGQQKLRESSVLIVGAGGLGAPTSLYLAAAGVGKIGLVDDDAVELSNLHRQVLFSAGDVGASKVDIAGERLKALNGNVEIELYNVRLAKENADALISEYDLVCDGSDNFATRYVVNDACVRTETPNVYASVHQFEGQASVFASGDGPCYRCLFPDTPPPNLIPSCEEGGVLGVLPGIMGSIQATETLKLLLGVGNSLSGTLLIVDSLSMAFRKLTITKDLNCTVCSSRKPRRRVKKTQPLRPAMKDMTVSELYALLQNGSQPAMLDVRQPEEAAICSIGGTLIPLGELPERADELEDLKKEDPLVVYCKAGGRSMQAVGFLQSLGFENVVNLQGGLAAWWAEIDPEMPRY